MNGSRGGRQRLGAIAVALFVGTAVAGPAAQRFFAHFAITAVPAQGAELACDKPCVVPGLLTLETAPWTQVVIDGEARGTTPLFKARLLPGPHTIRFINEDSALDHSETFEVAGGMVTRVKGTFDQQGAASHETLPLKPSEQACDDCASELTAPSYLTVNSQPWAVVYVDGRRLGTTPLFRARVGAGARQVRLETESGDAWAETVSLEQDATTRLQVVDGQRVTAAPDSPRTE